jgi:hypothetical protein
MNTLKGSFTNSVKVIMLNSVGLSTQRHSRRIKHPLAMNNVGYLAPHFIHYPRVSVSQTRELDSEPSGLDRKRSRPLRALHGALLCGSLSAYINYICRSYPTMIYTFLIANKNKLAELNTSRKISVCADSEQQARASLNGLPLLFVSQTPTGRAI